MVVSNLSTVECPMQSVHVSQMWLLMSLIPSLGKQRQVDFCEFNTSLANTVGPCFSKNKTTKCLRKCTFCMFRTKITVKLYITLHI